MLTVVPADQASWDDLLAIFGDRGDPARCRCQYFKDTPAEWCSGTAEDRAERLRAQTADHATGLVAHLDGEPAGWCAVEPRTAYRRLLTSRLVWAGRDEDKADDGVWAVTCFVTRKGFRRRGVSAALAKAAGDFARERGARAVEGYPMVVEPGEKLAWPGELFVGAVGIFADAGFTEVSRPTARRVVMRLTC
ncbi:GNAT family N-acetyltransferase [Amycolatopsis sp. Hca4]|uniref:GNAT family N-acetyltransferase n=1 Tax=Amycolatopsis sp. Hca4 TaxID=2742131 RepID=UPI001590E3C3|nr:GNAT family N-acetyltransferase [Amycolatopsis sp. Hca4]QKV78636.1 GNAT family N-acetyltransferase [Amycolatopsis sp. Hca4]